MASIRQESAELPRPRKRSLDGIFDSDEEDAVRLQMLRAIAEDAAARRAYADRAVEGFLHESDASASAAAVPQSKAKATPKRSLRMKTRKYVLKPVTRMPASLKQALNLNHFRRPVSGWKHEVKKSVRHIFSKCRGDREQMLSDLNNSVKFVEAVLELSHEVQLDLDAAEDEDIEGSETDDEAAAEDNPNE